ncbi:MAG: hypothetical protein IT462_03750 [Planctomycetes bacterium]|nr:hypothetical protein [Planctomycetota bacterium]
MSKRSIVFCAGLLALWVGACGSPHQQVYYPLPGDGERPAPAPAPVEPSGDVEPVAAATDETPVSGWKYQQRLDKAVKFLLDTQKKDGGWGHFLPERPGDIYIGGLNTLLGFGNASTALCAMGLMLQPETPEINAALVKGIKHMIDAPDAARIDGGTFYDTWAHAYMLTALARGLKDDRLADLHAGMRGRIKLELKRLAELQGLSGGWGYYDWNESTYRQSGEMATSFTTATALVSLKELQDAGIDVSKREIEIGLDFLERLRIPTGAYCYSVDHTYYPHGTPNKVRGSLGRSQAGDNALISWDRTLKAADIKAAMDRFFKDHVFIEIGRSRQWPHEAWYATAPYYYYYGHYYAARNLDHLPQENRNDYAGKLADLIARTQYDDGSFWDYPLFGYTKAYGTGFGVLILSYCKQHLADAK